MMIEVDVVFTLGLAVFIPLIVHACTMHRRLRRQAASIDRLSDVLTRLTREQVDVAARTMRTERGVRNISERQDSLEARPVAGQRIESAVRVARQGAANPELLRELGLSEAEASLLMRLHTIEEAGSEKAGTTSRPTAGQASSLARLLTRARTAETSADAA